MLEFTGNLEELETDASDLIFDGSALWSAGNLIDSSFRGLDSYYSAPEAEQLFATTGPVATVGDDFATELETVGTALAAYAAEVRPLVKRLEELQEEARAFRTSIAGDEHWKDDESKANENAARRSEMQRVWEAFTDAERACSNKIYALYTGFRLVPDDGQGKKPGENEYGYSADMLEDAEGLPWGDKTVESIRWFEVHRQAKHFIWDGLVMDFGVGTVKGLGALVGLSDDVSAGQAWSNLGKVLTGLGMLIAVPHALAVPDKYMPKYLQESRTALKEAGKAMISYDQWGKDNARALGGTTGNVLTTIFTGGAGTAAKAGTFAKVVSVTGKAARFIDPMTYVVKGAGAGVKFSAVKLGDALANLKMLRTGEYLRIGEGAYRLPDTPASRAEAAAFPPERFERLEDFDGNTIYADKANKGEWFNPDGTRYTEKPAPLERSADQRAAAGDEAAKPREPALVGATARAGETSAHTGDGFEPGAARGADDGAGAARDLTSGRTGDASSGQQAGRGQGGDNGIPTRSGGSGGGLDGPGHGGDDALGNAGPADDAARDAGDGAADQADAGSGPSRDGGRQLTVEELREIRDEHVRLANENPDWFKDYYRTNEQQTKAWRRDIYAKYEGDYLTELTKDASGKWVAKHDMAYGVPETRFNPTPYSRESAPDQVQTHLDDVSTIRRQGMELTAAEKAYKKNPSAENLDAVQRAREALGGRANNSKLGERLGEDAARYHVVPQHFDDPKWIELPKTPNGADAFDQLWELKNDELVIAEAKGPKADLDWRQGQVIKDGVKVPSGKMVKQGTLEYAETICAEMLDRAARSPRDARLALRILEAIENKKLHYVMIKANENTGKYSGAMLEHLKLFEGE
ncbi:hypothetical protein [Streptomyces sp. NBC_01304]|uniref:hypothetical protein n=1 Tax=Streptomyces sp. NBC_01304 TaxID=2903818 RepID=UPI002E157C76|nr:hypothetical protein OG430_33555 [Streptomyces sp. NBC_01304]